MGADPLAQLNSTGAVNSAYWAVLQGRLAGVHPVEPAAVNPYRLRDPDGAIIGSCRSRLSRALALCWDYGHAGMPRAAARDRETVSRETIESAVNTQAVVEGAPVSITRAPRDDWRAYQIEVLHLARSGGQGKLTDRQLAVIVGKTHAAVRVKLSRLRKESKTV